MAYRCWEEGGHAGLHPFDPPEIETSDLSSLVLALAGWGTNDPAKMAWLDTPSDASVETARARLKALGALDQSGAITQFGKQVAALPMAPDQAAMVLLRAKAGQAEEAARLALLLQERGLGGRSEDLLARLDRWKGDRSPRAETSCKLAARWAKQAKTLVGRAQADGRSPAVFLALARPDMVARVRGGNGENWLSAGGRGYFLDPASPLARADWLVIGDAQGRAKGARITSAAVLTAQDIEDTLADLIERRSILRWNESEGRVEARQERRMEAITLATGPDSDPDPDEITAFLLEKACERLDDLLPAALIARASHAGTDALSLEILRDEAETWLAPLLQGKRGLDLPEAKLVEALLNRLDWSTRQTLDELASREFVSPAGTHNTIDYADPGGPSVELRVQALFGLDTHPQIGRTPQPLLIKLTSPAGRPIQTTRDLPGFWRGSWRDVVRDMKGRYPRHRWPDQPWTEKPSLKTKPAFEK